MKGGENDGKGPPSHVEGHPKPAGADESSTPAGVGKQSRPATRGKPDDALGATSPAGTEIIDLVDSDTNADTRCSSPVATKRQRPTAPAGKPAGGSGPADAGATESPAKKRCLRVPKIPGNPVV